MQHPGVEVTLLERRSAWTKIQLASGLAGWGSSGTVERIAH